MVLMTDHRSKMLVDWVRHNGHDDRSQIKDACCLGATQWSPDDRSQINMLVVWVRHNGPDDRSQMLVVWVRHNGPDDRSQIKDACYLGATQWSPDDRSQINMLVVWVRHNGPDDRSQIKDGLR